MLSRSLLSFALMLVLVGSAYSSEPRTGPVIENYGPVFDTPKNVLNLEINTRYKVSMDISKTAEQNDELNHHFESVARFLNMHARNGIDLDNIQFAVIVHGAAAKDLLLDSAYQARFEEPNPNTALLDALGNAGVQIYLCGQTAAYRGYKPEELNPNVSLSLSAMTAHVRLQSEGFTLIPF